LRRLTEDHSLVNDMILHGQITPRDARKHHLRNYLTRSVGARSPVSVDLRAEEWSGGDLLLLCSDGLTGPVDDKAIQGILTRAGLDLDRACRDLVRAAKSRGGHDNISVVIARRG
jgi:serine/threonine protein phosphatase PrpC